jgi:hypothetical protein
LGGFAAMVKFFRSSFASLLLLFLALFSAPSFASFTVSSSTLYVGYEGNFSTPQAACDSRIPHMVTLYGAGEWKGDITFDSHCSLKKWLGSYWGEYYAAWLNTTTGVVAPSNSTCVGSTCTCDVGYVENSTQSGCELPPAPCAWAENLVLYANGSFSIERGKNACFNGCEFALRPDAGFALESSRLSSDSPWFDVRTVPDFAGTGQVCDPLTTGASSGTTEPTPYPPGEDGVRPPDACPKDQVPGTVNGVTICVDPGIREVKSATTSTVDDGTNTTEKTEDKQTTCVGETCTTTTTTVTNVTNNSTSTVTSSTITGSETTTKGEYCKSNPYDKLCTADGQGAASGDCSELDSDCTQKLGDLGAEPFANTNRAMSITAQAGWGEGGGSCPAPRVVNVAGITLEMPFDLLCEFADGIRPIIIALAWLSAALAFLGLSKRD